jgi:hypothetical protein
VSGVSRHKLALGCVLLLSFAIVLFAIFMPLADGQNTLAYLDNLYNSIAKGSANYLPKLREKVASHAAERVSLSVALESAISRERAASILGAAGLETSQEGPLLTVSGELGVLLEACLVDADAMYHNRGAEVSRRYGMDEREALHTWWLVLGGLERGLNLKERFADASLVATLKIKTVETAYNFYGIEPQSIADRWFIVLLSLVFYIVYTVWYGYGIMYLFEGLGIRLSRTSPP